MPEPKRIRRALISVYDKTGIVDFARALHEEFGIEIISTGGTAKLLKENGIPVTLVEEITGFPEMLDGRVKTLHPKIHAAILADRDNPEHMRQLAEQGIEPIDLVVVNLYPFEETIAKPDCTFEEAIEMIDIGGVALLRAAAKNHRHVAVVWCPGQLELVLGVLGMAHCFDAETRLHWACRAYELTQRYDRAVQAHLYKRMSKLRRAGSSDERSEPAATEPAPIAGAPVFDGDLPVYANWSAGLAAPLSYGENPHQMGGLYYPLGEWEAVVHGVNLAELRPLQGAMSFNNYADASAAMDLCVELSRAAALCGTGFQPVSSTGGGRPPPGLRPLDDEKHARRNLPHIQTPGKTYFVTFRLKRGDSLRPEERTIVFDACRFWAGKKIDLHAVVVMPDHVHMLLTPLEIAHGTWVTLGEILQSIKLHSARQINKLRGRTGPLWLDESFDRIMRNEKEFVEKADYIANNPIKQGLVEDHSYPWWWDEDWHRHRLQTGATPGSSQQLKTGASPGPGHRLETGATPEESLHEQDAGATTEESLHREDAGATPKPFVCVFIKHANACGTGVADDPMEAYRRAYLGDPNAAMGGVLACNFTVTTEFAGAVMDAYQRWGKQAGASGFFVEVWLAPSFDAEAVRIIRGEAEGRPQKDWGKRLRLLEVGDMAVAPDPGELDFKKIAGGMLVQTRDLVGLNEDQWKVVTDRQPTEQEMDDLRLAWLICKHTKSNAISICKDGMLIGNGAGQMSRVMSCRIATWLANENGHRDKLPGSAAASDGFFPFRDGPDLLMDAGVSAIIQPGGSKRDAETIEACNQRGAAMIFTGTRHFKH